MRKLISIIISCILCAIVISCAEKEPEYDNRLVGIYEMLADYNNTDSAFQELKRMNVNQFSEEHNKAYYAYLYTLCLYWLNAHAEDDTLIKVAIDYYSKTNDLAMKAKSFTYAAFVYQSIGEKETAVECFNRALEAIPEDSVNLKAQIYSNWAVMINMDKPDEESMELYEKVKVYAWKANNIYLVADAWIQQGANHLYHDHIDDAINSYQEALSLLKNEEWGDGLRFASLNKLAHCYALKNDNEIALNYAKEAEKYVSSITTRRYLNDTFSKIYINTKQWNKAEACLALADDTLAYNGKVIYLKRLIKIEQGKGNYRKASNLIDRYIQCSDSMYLALIEDNASMYQKKYDKTKVELEKSVLAADNKQLQATLMLIVIMVAIATLITLALAYRRHTINSQREKAKDDAMSGLTQELQGKIIELQEVRLQLSDREKAVTDSQQELEEAQRRSQELKTQIFEMNGVVQKVLQLKKAKTADLYGTKHTLGKEELDVLIEALDFCYNGVMSKLKAGIPNINRDELNMCALMCIGLPVSKISLLLGMSEESLRQRKYRLRRAKMTQPDNITIDMYIEELKAEA